MGYLRVIKWRIGLCSLSLPHAKYFFNVGTMPSRSFIYCISKQTYSIKIDTDLKNNFFVQLVSCQAIRLFNLIESQRGGVCETGSKSVQRQEVHSFAQGCQGWYVHLLAFT